MRIYSRASIRVALCPTCKLHLHCSINWAQMSKATPLCSTWKALIWDPLVVNLTYKWNWRRHKVMQTRFHLIWRTKRTGMVPALPSYKCRERLREHLNWAVVRKHSKSNHTLPVIQMWNQSSQAQFTRIFTLRLSKASPAFLNYHQVVSAAQPQLSSCNFSWTPPV